MHEYTDDQIQERYNELPQEIRDVLTSDGVLESIKSIAKKNNLVIDEIGDLVDQVVLILLGFAKSSTFPEDLTKRIPIDIEQAKTIAVELNESVFAPIRNKMMEPKEDVKPPEKAPKPVSSLEKVGNFTIEPDARDQKMPQNKPSIATPQPVNRLVDQLMSAPAAIPEEKIAKTAWQPISTTPPVVETMVPTPPPNLPTSDSYREPIK